MKKSTFLRLFFLFGLLILLFNGLKIYDIQWDLTVDQRYTLNDNSKIIIDRINQPLGVDVFLAGDIPPEYQRLRSELTILLNQLKKINDFIDFNFVDPFEGNDNREQLLEDLYRFGLTPEIEIDQENQSTEQTLVVPWIVLNQGKRSVRVSLLQKNLGDTPAQRMEQSIQLLEYTLMDGLHQLLLKKKKRIAVIKSHGTSEDKTLLSLLQSLLPYYNLAAFDLRAFPNVPQKTLENLLRFDLVLVSNPTELFTVEEKFMIDQFTQQGGSSLFLIDPINIAKDSLFSLAGNAIAYANPLELDELFFKYGARFNQDIVTDLFSAPIVLAQGENAQSDYKPYPWIYHPLVQSTGNHPIGSSIRNIHQRFVSSLDTLNSSVKKTILLNSSQRSKRKRPPFLISLEEAIKPLKPSEFDEEAAITGLLLEGNFPSLFTNRIAPFEWKKTTLEKPAKMALFSDGNMAENQMDKGEPLELGYDKWTNNLYGNKPFLQNTIHYLMNENERLLLRSKEVQLAFLDREKVDQNRLQYSLIAILLPLILLGALGGLTLFYRRQNIGQ